MKTDTNDFPARRFMTRLTMRLIFIFASNALLSTPAAAQNECTTALIEAQKMYEAGRFIKAIELLAPCALDSLPAPARRQAYRLLALAHLAEDHREKAENTVEDLLEHDPYYEADPIHDPQPFVELIKKFKEQQNRKLVKQAKINYSYPLLLPDDNSDFYDQNNSFVAGFDLLLGNKFFGGFSFEYSRFLAAPQNITGEDSPIVIGTFKSRINGQFYALALMYKTNAWPRRWELAPFVMLKIGYLRRKFDPGTEVRTAGLGQIKDNSFAKSVAVGMEIPVKASLRAFASFNYFVTRKYEGEAFAGSFNFSRRNLTGSLGFTFSF